MLIGSAACHGNILDVCEKFDGKLPQHTGYSSFLFLLLFHFLPATTSSLASTWINRRVRLKLVYVCETDDFRNIIQI